MINKNDNRLAIKNGLMMIDSLTLTGIIYSLDPDTGDTLSLSGYRYGKEHGEWKQFYAAGKLKDKRFFNAGLKTGEYVSWWSNGNRQLQYFFEQGEYSGVCREWNEMGRLVKQMNYVAGHEEGSQQWWYDNGKIKANYVIKAGRRFGLLGTKNCVNAGDSIFTN